MRPPFITRFNERNTFPCCVKYNTHQPKQLHVESMFSSFGITSAVVVGFIIFSLLFPQFQMSEKRKQQQNSLATFTAIGY